MVSGVMNRLITKKHVGELINKVNNEYELYKATSTKMMNEDTVTYSLVNGDSQILTVGFVHYKTGWKVTFLTDGYDSELLGSFKQVHETFNNGTKLNEFLTKHKYSKINITKALKEESIFEIISRIKDNVKDSLELNYQCLKNVFLLEDIDKIMKTFATFIPDSNVMNLLNLFNLFNHIDKICSENEFVHDVALSILAKEIFELKKLVVAPINVDNSFEIEASSNPICYAHVLQFYGGKCKYLHGHNGKLVIKANVLKDTITKRPMFLSYGFLKGFLKHMDNKLDHKTFWSLNKTYKMTRDMQQGLKVETPCQSIIFKDLTGVVLFPYNEGAENYSTSEVTLYNYVLPQFLIYLVRFFINDNGVDSTLMAFYDMSEPIKFSFKWYETESTVCTISVDC